MTSLQLAVSTQDVGYTGSQLRVCLAWNQSSNQTPEEDTTQQDLLRSNGPITVKSLGPLGALTLVS